MACETKTKEIGDREYSVTQWAADKSILMKLRLVKVFGASLAKLMETSNSPSDNKKSTTQDETLGLSEGISALFLNNSPEDILGLIKNCVIGVGCNGKRITETSFNELFTGDTLVEVYKVFLFVLEVNYSNLLKGQSAERFLATMKEKL